MADATVEQLLSLADKIAGDIKRAEEVAATIPQLRKTERGLRKMAAEQAGESRLRIDRSERIMPDMDVNTHSHDARVRSGAGRATRKHPAQKKLYERGKTITSIASELKEGRPRVSAWFADGEANRPIPKRHAETLKEKYGIPLSAWSRVAD